MSAACAKFLWESLPTVLSCGMGSGTSSTRLLERGVLKDRVRAFVDGRSSEGFEELILDVHAFQKSANPAYAAFCAASPNATHWTEIPAVPQQAFKTTELRSFPEDETQRIFHTSGTTGEGVGRHFFRDLDLYQTVALAGWKAARLPDKVDIALLPHPSEVPHSSLSQMAAWLADPSAFLVRDGALDAAALARLIGEANNPIVVFGTALAFLHAIETATPGSLTLPPGSRVVETGGYKGSGREVPRGELYRLFTEHFGIPPGAIVNEYGMTELSSQFYSEGPSGAHRGGGWIRARILDPGTGKDVEDGESGVLQLYDLANIDSVCAVLTRDLATRDGDVFHLLGRDPLAVPRGCSRAADEMLARS